MKPGAAHASRPTKPSQPPVKNPNQPTQKPPAAKSSAKTRTPAARKTASRKAASRKAASRKAAPRKAPARKATPRKTTARKGATKKSASKKSATRKTTRKTITRKAKSQKATSAKISPPPRTFAPEEHEVLVLDDNPSVRRGLERLLASNGFKVRLHHDPDDFLNSGPPEVPACLLLDNQLEARLSGIEVHAEIVNRGWNLPTIFLTAHWNVQSVVSAIRAGADGFLTKPYDSRELLVEVGRALDRARISYGEHEEAATIRRRYQSLTPRERQILDLALDGFINKEISTQLGIALVTVKVHRGRAMNKLGAVNIADLARMARLAGIRA